MLKLAELSPYSGHVLLVLGVCAILVTVFLGLAVLLAIVLRGTDSAKDKKMVLLALRELVAGTLVAVAQLPARLTQAFVSIFWQGPPSADTQAPTSVALSSGHQQLPRTPNAEQQAPPADPVV
ncbi:hypothetical protein [Lentzea flaviverrucosa]|nr:hypothetical protein [Lentzea flaviverrucosa]